MGIAGCMQKVSGKQKNMFSRDETIKNDSQSKDVAYFSVLMDRSPFV